MPKVKPSAIITADFPQSVAQFNPTASMKVWLDTAINLATDSPAEIAEESNLSRQGWYKWLDIPGFEDWYFENYRQKRRRWLPKLDKIGMENAQNGKYDFWKDMNKKAGEILDGVSTNVQVNVLNQIKSDKDKYGI